MANEPLKTTNMRFATLILTTSFIVGSIAGPLSSHPQQCSLTCNSENKKFDYAIGKTYIYKYTADSETRLSSEKSEQSRLRIQAEVEIEPISKCDYILRLGDVSLEDLTNLSPKPIIGNDKFKSALEQYPLRFEYQDGHIGNLCPNQNDPIWVLNIKRGILSTFQNSMENLSQDASLKEEVDITGRCLTHYKIINGSGWPSTVHIKKFRDLVGCKGRTDHYTSFQTNPYHPNIAAKTPPLVKSDHNCEQVIESSQLKSSICRENHAFQPFSNQKSGAISTISQKLNLIKLEAGKFAGNEGFISKRTSLLFDHKYRELGKTSDKQEAEDALRELCLVASDDIRPEVPKLFSRLVHKLQELNYEKLLSIYKNVHSICKGNRKAKKFLYDAVPLTGSDAGVTLMRDLILRQEISKSEADSWLMMISFLPRPSKEIITAMMPLLDRPVERPKALLGVSALTYSYCKTNPNCGQEPEVKNLVKKLALNLKDNCKTQTDSEKETVIVTLKALGNIGHIDDAISTLEKCYENTDSLMEVRLAALDAFRRLPCKYNRKFLMGSYFNYEEDAEIRIGAYMTIMKCPTPETLTKIHQKLDDEEVNQVGSFVWTHLTSLQETSDPYKQEVRKILSSKKLQKKFSTDVRKFSRYYEGSIFFDSIKTGAMAEGTVVFSPKSYLPRSTTLGLTVDVFGESINLFEVGGRVEGLEYLVESFFGPKGYFPDDAIKKILESAREKKAYDEDKLNEIAKIFNVKHFAGEDPRGSMFMRIFGNEIGVLQFRGIEQLLQRSTAGFNILHELIQLTQKEDSEYTKSFMFMDSSLIIPTAIGLPLNLTVNGTATVNLRVGGKLDLSQLRSKSLQFKIKVQPSAAVEIASSMVVDAFVARSGLKMVATVHTSTYANAEVVLEKGEVLRAHIDVPKNKMEVLDIQNNLFLLEGQSERKLSPLVTQQVHFKKCTGSSLSKVLGLQLCGEVNYPLIDNGVSVPNFLLSGPMAAKIYLDKTDEAMTSYNLDYKWDKQPLHDYAVTPYIRTGRFSLNTPKSTVNRELTAEFVYNEEDKSLGVNLISPIKSISFNGKLVNDRDYKKLQALININGKEQFLWHSGIKLDKKGDIYLLTPNVSLRLGGQPVLDIKGSLLRQQNKKYNIEMTMEHITSQPITIKGSLTKNSKIAGHRYDADFTLNSSPLYWYTKWFLQTSELKMATKGTIEYRWFDKEKQSMTFSAKSDRSPEPTKDTLSGEASFQWSAHPQLDWTLNWEHQRAVGHMENSLAFYYGAKEHRSENMLSIRHSYDRNGSWVEHQVASAVRVLFPPADVDTTIELTHRLTQRSLDTNLTLKYGGDRQIAFHVDVTKPSHDPRELIRGRATLGWPNHQWELKGDVRQPTPEDLVVTVSGKWAEDSEARAVVTLEKQLEPNWGRKLTVEFALPGQEPIVLTGDVLMTNAEQSVHGEVLFHSKKYRTFAEYHRPALENVRVVVGANLPSSRYSAAAKLHNGVDDKTATASVVLGSDRRMVADLRVKRDGRRISATADLNLDADREPKGAYTLKSVIENADHGSEGNVTLSWYDNDLGFGWNVSRNGSSSFDPYVFRGNYEAWYGRNQIDVDVDLTAALRPSLRDIKASVTVGTPFANFRELSMTGMHLDDGRQWFNEAQFQLEGRKLTSCASEGSFASDPSGHRVQMTITLDTPLSFVPSLLALEHLCTQRMTTFNVTVQLPNESQAQLVVTDLVDVTSAGDARRQLIANLTTPCSWARDVSMATTVIRTKNTMVQAELQWNDDRYTIDSESRYVMTDDKTSVYHSVQLRTPFQNFESISASFKLNLDKVTLAATGHFGWTDNRSVVVEVVANSPHKGTQKHGAISVHLLSPFEYLKDVVILARLHKQSPTDKQYTLEFSWASRRMVTAEFKWSALAKRALLLKADVRETFGLFGRLTAEVSYANADEHPSLRVVLTARDHTLQFDANWPVPRNVGSGSGLVRLYWTVQGVDMALVEVSHSFSPSAYSTGLKMTLVHNTVELSNNISFGDAFKLDNRLEWRSVDLVLDIQNSLMLTATEFQHKTTLMSRIWHEHPTKLTATTKWQVTPNLKHIFEGSAQLDQPLTRYGPFRMAASHEWVGQELKQGLTIEYGPGRTIDITSSSQFDVEQGRARVTVVAPLWGFNPVTLLGHYNLADREKFADFKVLANDQSVMEMSAIGQFDRDLLKLTVILDGYERAEARISADGRALTKTICGSILYAGHALELSAEGMLNDEIGNFTLEILSPFPGYERLTLSGDIHLNSRDRGFGFRSDVGHAKVDIAAFYRTSPTSIDNGFTLTSSVQGLERIVFATHYGTSSNDVKKASVIFEKGVHKVEFTATSKTLPKDSYVSLVLTSPFDYFALVQFDVKFVQPADDRKSLLISAVHNSDALNFEVKVKGRVRDHNLQVDATLNTPFEAASQVTITGGYDIAGPIKSAEVSFEVDGQTAKLQCKLELLPKKVDVLVSLSSPIEGAKMVTFNAVVKTEASSLGATMKLSHQAHVFEAVLQSSWSAARVFGRLALQTPFAGYQQLTGSVEYDGSATNRQRLNVLLQKEKHKMTLEAELAAELAADVNVTEVSVTVATPVSGYELVSIVGKLEAMKLNILHVLTLQKGSAQYKALWNWAHTPASYLETKLQLRIPGDNFMFYVNYNLNGANAVTFDAKLIRQMTMMEVGGRFWKHPRELRADASLIFNTNFVDLIAASVSGRFDLTGQSKEVAFKTDLSGRKLELMGTATTADHRVTIKAQGSSSIPEWKMFKLAGTIDDRQTERLVHLKFTKNNQDMEVKGKILHRRDAHEGSLNVLTPYAGYESLSAQVVLSHRSVSVVVKREEVALMQLTAGRNHQGPKMDASLEFQSQLDALASFAVGFSADFSGTRKIAEAKLTIGSANARVKFMGTGDRNNKDVTVSISGNVRIPLLNASSGAVRLAYDRVKQMATAEVTADGEELYAVVMENLVQEPGSTLITIRYPHQNVMRVKVQNHRDATSQRVGFVALLNQRELLKISANLAGLESGSFELRCVRCRATPVGVSVRYETTAGMKSILAEFTENDREFQFGGSLSTDRDGDNGVTGHAMTITFKSPIEAVQDVTFRAELRRNPSAQSTSATVNLQWGAGQQVLLAVDIATTKGASALLTTPFQGYEKFGFVAEHHHQGALQKTVFELAWSSKKIGVLLERTSNNIGISFTSPFAGFERLGAMVTYNSKPFESHLVLQHGADKIEVIAHADLQPKKSLWKMSIRTPFADHESYQLEGGYNFLVEQSVRLLIESPSKRFESRLLLRVDDDQKTRHFSWNTTTPLQSFSGFDVDVRYSMEPGEKAAILAVRLNGQTYRVGGNVQKSNDTLRFNFETGTANDHRFLVLDGQANATGSQMSGEMVLRHNDQTVFTIAGALDRRLPHSVQAELRVTTPTDVLKVARFTSRFENDAESTKLTVALSWNEINNAILVNGQLSSSDVQLTINTPFAAMNRFRFDSKWKFQNRTLLTFAASYDVDGAHHGSLEVLWHDQMPRHLETSLEVTTSCPYFDKLGASLEFSNNEGRMADGQFLLHTPFRALPEMKVDLEFRNSDVGKASGSVQLELPSSRVYSVKVAADGGGDVGSSTATLVIKTPHQNYETITLKGNAFYVDSAERGAEWSLTTPTTRHVVRANFVLKPGNMGLEATVESTLIPVSPISVSVRYDSREMHSQLAFSYGTSDGKTVVAWTRISGTESASKGAFVLERTWATSSIQDIWNLEYMVGSPSTLGDQVGLITNLIHQQNSLKNELASVSVILKRGGLDANVFFKQGDIYHQATVHFEVANRRLEGAFNLSSPLLPCKSFVITGSLHSQEATLKVDIGEVQNIFSASLQSRNSADYEGLVKIEAPSLDLKAHTAMAKLKIKKDVLQGELSIQTPMTTHRVSGFVSRSATQIATQLMLRTPYFDLQYVTLDGHITLNGERQINSVFTVNFQRQTHRLSFDLDYESEVLDSTVKLTSPLLDGKVLAIHLRLMKTTPGAITCLLDVTMAGEVHRGGIEVNCGNDSTNALLSLDTPIWDINSVSLKSSLKNHRDGGFNADVMMNTPQSTHSLTCQYNQGPLLKLFRINATTPYLGPIPYQLSAQLRSEAGTKEVSLTFHTIRANHTVTLAYQNNGQAARFRLMVATPVFNIQNASIMVDVRKFGPREVEASVGVEFRGQVHTATINIQRPSSRIMNFNFSAKTPILQIGALGANGHLKMVNTSRLDVAVNLTMADQVFSTGGHLDWDGTGVGGHFDMNAPSVGPMELTARISRLSLQSFEARILLKIKGSMHDLHIQFLHRNANVSFRGKLESSLLPWESVVIAGDVSFHLPVNVVGGFALETPGRIFRFLGNYRNRNLEGVEGGLTIVTPFQSLPFLRVNGKMAKNIVTNGFSSDLEMHTQEKGPPEAAFYVRCNSDAHENWLTTITWQIPVLDYRNIVVSYGSQILNDSRWYGTARLQADGYAYGYEGILSRQSNSRSVQVKVYTGKDRFVLRTTMDRKPGKRHLSLLLETPIKELQHVNYDAQCSFDGSGRYGFRSMLTGTGFKYGVTVALNYTGTNNLDGTVLFETLLSGYDRVTFKFKKFQTEESLQGSFEQLLGDQTMLQILIENIHSGNTGHGRLQLTTPLRILKTAIAFYEYDNLTDRPSGNLSVSRNGQTLLQINTLYKDDLRTVEVINPIQPIIIRYSYTISDGVIKIHGDYCWDIARAAEAMVGFDIAVTYMQHAMHIILSSIHPVRPQTVTITAEITPTLFMQRTEVTSLATKSSMFYEIRSLRREDQSGDVEYDTNFTVSFPARTVQLLTNYQNNGRNLVTDARFKWDAFRDDSKLIGLRLEHRSLSATASRMDISYLYPKLVQNLTFSWEYATYPESKVIFSSQCTLGYGKAPSEKFTIRSKVTDISNSPLESGYALEVDATHPASNLDVGIKSHWMNTSQDISGGLNLHYLSRQGQMKNMEVTSKISKLRKRIEMMMKSHLSKLEMSAEMKRLSNGYLLHLESKKDDHHPVMADLQLNFEDIPMAEFSAIYGSRQKSRVNVRAGMQDKKTILMKAYHQGDKDMTDDINLLMNLNRSRELVTRFYWRPGVLQELEEGIIGRVRSICRDIRTSMLEFTEEASLEFQHKYRGLLDSFSKIINPMVREFASEMEALNKDVQKMQQAVQQMYLHDDFYLRSISNIVDFFGICKHVCESVRTLIQSSTKCVQSIITSSKMIFQRLQEFCDYLCNNMSSTIQAHIQDLPYAIMHFSRKLNEFRSKTINDIALQGLKFIKDFICYWIPPINEWKIVTPEWIRHISNQVFVQLQTYLEQFIGSHYFETVKNGINQILACLQELYNSEFLLQARMWCKPIISLLEKSTQNLWNHPYVRNIEKGARIACEMGVWAYDFLKIEDRVRDLLGSLISRIEDIALLLVQEMILPEYHLPSLRNEMVFEPENGKLEILQTLPIMWNSFTELPSLYASPEYNDVMKLKDSLIRLPKASLQKLYHAMRSEFTWKHMVPPFKGRALLVGDQHYMTFDGRAYEFAGACSYLLAHDFMDKNFTAIVKYDRHASDVVEKTFSLSLNGDIFEIHQNLTLTISGKLQELPLTIGSTRISRGHHSLRIRNDAKQVWALYKQTHDTFVLEIGGFYHGKTAGLFGTYDHEPFNDFTTSKQKKTSNLEEFASSWEVNSQPCMSRKNYAHLSMTNSYAIQKTCNDAFTEYGMLTPCIRKINPNPYKKMCINDVSAGKSTCSATGAYVMMCQLNGIMVTMPDTCLACEIGSKLIPQGEEMTLEGVQIPQSVDVVFVIDNTWQCSTTFPNLRNRLSTISRNIEGALSGIPLKNNRYAVVGFDVGSPYIPQVITANGEIFAGLEFIDLALNNTHFAAGHYHQIAELIDFATELPYRPEVGKIMVIVPCAEPTELYRHYNALASKLKEMDIILHVTSIHEPILNAANKIKLDDIIGVDKDVVYTLKSSERGALVGDRTIRQQMNIPRNTLTSLALDSNGSIFYTSRLHSAQASISKLAIEIFARRIAQNASPTDCQSCLCSTGSDGSPRALCSKCISDNPS